MDTSVQKSEDGKKIVIEIPKGNGRSYGFALTEEEARKLLSQLSEALR